MFSKFRFFLACSILFSSFVAHAQDATNYLIVPTCLISNKYELTELGRAKNLVLIQTQDMAGLQAVRIKKRNSCRGFINVTESWSSYAKRRQTNAPQFIRNYLPEAHPGEGLRGYRIQFQDKINPLLKTINLNQLRANLNQLAAFRDRYADSDSGIDATNWLIQQIQTMVVKNPDIEIQTVATPGENSQPSIVVKYGKNLTGPAVVIGSHFDTLASNKEYKPGADDNASGSVTLLEILRVLANSHTKLQKPVYFIWYAAKEQGELGSQSVVKYFNRKHISVAAALNLDKTGYMVKENNGIGLTDDYTDISLTAFAADLVATYVNLTASAVHGGFACSDHISWYQNNVPVVYPYETIDDAENPYTLTRFDKTGLVSAEHMADFVKLGTAFAVELALS